MSAEIEELVRKLDPFIPELGWAERKLHLYYLGKFNPAHKKAIEAEVKSLAIKHDIENQILIHPLPKTYEVGGEYSVGNIH